MGSPDPARIPSQERRRRPRYWLRRFVALLVLLLPVVIWQGWSFFKRSLPLPAEGDAPRIAAREPVYVVILGVDERKQDIGRSDTILLVRLAVESPSIDAVSIPRDTLATFPDGKPSKVNAAYSIAGPELVTRVVSDLLSIQRPYYVKINLESFERIVDKLGGVDLTVDRHYVYNDPYQNLHIDIPAGPQHMNGGTALKFVRIRYDGVTNDDIARIKRQQQFLQAMQSKLSSPAAWVKMPELVTTMRKYVSTNIPEADQLTLAEALFMARSSVRMQTLPGTPDDRTGDWILDKAAWSEVIKSWAQK